MASVKDLTRFGIDLSEARLISHEDYAILVAQGCRPEVGDVLIAKDGNSALDTVCNVKNEIDAVLLSSVAILRPNPDVIDSDFLKFFLSAKSTIDYLKSHFISGAAIPRVVLKDFRRAEIGLPPLEVQKQISNILNSVEGKIELNRQINRTLEEMAQAIFKSWFVDFDPVKAKMAAIENGEDPERAAMRAISGKSDEELDALPRDQLDQLAATAALFPSSLTDSPLGPIPEGWRITNVRDVSSLIFSGGTPDTRKPEFWGGEHNWFSSGETRNSFVVTTEKTITRQAIDNSSTKLACPGDILIASAGQGNTRGQTSFCGITTYINQSVVSIRADGSIVPPIWLFYNLSSRYDEMRSISDSHSSRGSLTTKLLGGMEVVCPPLDVSMAFAEIADPFSAKQIENMRENDSLAETRDTLLPKLLSGELSVGAAEAELEEAL